MTSQRRLERVVVVGDVHAQTAKFWRILNEAGVADGAEPSAELISGRTQLVLLGDLVHAKTRAQYASLIGEGSYDEFHPPHIRRAEEVQETFLRELRSFCERASGNVTVILGNHDHNALTGTEGVLSTDGLSHLEWRERALPGDLRAWLATWPTERVVENVHFAHVGPKAEHNRYDADFYLRNRRDWILEDRDPVAEASYRFGVYGHTPVRGGAHFASQGRALLLDMNGFGDEYAYLTLTFTGDEVSLELRGVFFSTVLE